MPISKQVLLFNDKLTEDKITGEGGGNLNGVLTRSGHSQHDDRRDSFRFHVLASGLLCKQVSATVMASGGMSCPPFKPRTLGSSDSRNLGL